jgi:hypothetical protein
MGGTLDMPAPLGENLFSEENSCYHAANYEIRLREKKRLEIFPGQLVFQNHFATAVAKPAV